MSARSTIRVLALAMSRPDSTIVVDTSTSYRFSQKPIMICSSASSPIWPCATATRASGHQLGHPGGSSVDGVHPVVDIERLPVT